MWSANWKRGMPRGGGAWLKPLILSLLWAGAMEVWPSRVSAQARESPTRVWLGVGLGGGRARGLDADGGIALQLAAQWGLHYALLRGWAMGDAGSFPDGSDDFVNSMALMYGRRAPASFGYAAVAAGPALVRGGGFSGAPTESRRTVGLSLVGEAGLQMTPVGLALQLFGNLNSVSTFGGFAVFLHLGWMP